PRQERVDESIDLHCRRFPLGDESGADSADTDQRFDDPQVVGPVEVTSGRDDLGRHDRHTLGIEVEQIALAKIPTEEPNRVYHRDPLAFEHVEPTLEVLEVRRIVPCGANQYEVSLQPGLDARVPRMQLRSKAQ